MRAEYGQRMTEIRQDFERMGEGVACIKARTALVDDMILSLWSAETTADQRLQSGIAIAAVGGYGRGQLFPYSDVDLLFLVDKNDTAVKAKDAIRRVTQQLWDAGLKLGAFTRPTSDCERFEASNPEFGFSLLDFRGLGGDLAVLAKAQDRCLPRLYKQEKTIAAELGVITRDRHSKYGNTLFHLEPNIKDCPGGLRDSHVADWLMRLGHSADDQSSSWAEEFAEANSFLASVRCYLHYRHERDDNVLNWAAQDGAAEQGIGLADRRKVDSAYWMRAYFRHARALERTLVRQCEINSVRLDSVGSTKSISVPKSAGFRVKSNRVELLDRTASGSDPAHEPEAVLAVFAAIAASGAKLSPASEERISDGIPHLSAHLEEGPALWRRLCAVLTGEFAADALRAMHALGVLELIIPEFHGIDALVIRDAYHRYTVDEHTFVLIDTLHGLALPAPKGAPEWRVKFGSMIRELQSPGLLYLAALMHDTGKGMATDDHATESARMAQSVLTRLEMDTYEAGLVVRLIRTHLEMSAALRRDIFDTDTVRAFASNVQTQESLRMLTLFTYADIAAVHPDAMTPWKAENLWRLSMAAANQLDRTVDEERVHTSNSGGEIRVAGVRLRDDRIARILQLARGYGQFARAGVERAAQEFLEGFPERYLETRPPEVIFKHFEMTQLFAEEPFQIAFRHGASISEIALVTRDRPRLFASMAAALAAWGMNVLTADAFANEAGVVVDSFRFTDSFRTLELNESERERFVSSVRDLVAGTTSVERMLNGRRRGRRRAPLLKVETRIEFDDRASSHSTLLQVIAQDIPGLLRAISSTISRLGHNMEVALVDTEGEVAIDVFYLTSGGERLNADAKDELRNELEKAIQENAA